MPQSKRLSEGDLVRLARSQLADYDARRPGTMFAGMGMALAVDDAYRLQIETVRLRRQRGDVVAGYKIGCVSETIRRQLGIDHPVFGHVFRHEIRASPAILSTSEFSRPGIEGEFAVELKEAIRHPSDLRNAPGRFVGEVYPVIELHNYLFRAPEPSAAELIANNALHAGVVVPAEKTSFLGERSIEIRVSIDNGIDAKAVVDPLATLPELVSRLDAYGIQPARGDLLLTGSPLPLYTVGPGDKATVTCTGLAELTATFRAD